MTTTINDIPDDVLASIIKFAGPSRDVQGVSKRFSGLTAEVALDTFNRLSNAEMDDDEYYLLRHVFQEVKAEFPLAETVGDVAVRALDTLYKRLVPHYPNKTFEEIHAALNPNLLSQFEKECQEESLVGFATILADLENIFTQFETTQERVNHIRTWLQQNANVIQGFGSLTINLNRLARFPREIVPFFINISRLEISGQCIAFLPKEIWQFSKMRILEINSPLEFFEVPEGNVPLLGRLSLCNTKLKKYPQDIEKFAANLVELSLAGNGIKNIPESIRVFNTMRELDVTNNPLKTLPDAIASLPCLRKLKVDWEKIATLSNRIVFESLANIRNIPQIYAYRWYGPFVNLLQPLVRLLEHLFASFILAGIITVLIIVITGLTLLLCSITISVELALSLIAITWALITLIMFTMIMII